MFKSVLKRIFNCKFHLRILCNPFIRLQIHFRGEFTGITKHKREVPVIISLTSYGERFKDLPLTLYSLFNQKTKPDRIILWLGDENNLYSIPYEIKQFIKNGLEIRFVKDIKSYTKVIYAFKEFSKSIIITADDDIYYPANWLEKLYNSYISYPEDIHVHRAHRVLRDKDRKIVPYERWKKHVEEEGAGYNNFLTGTGGVLYPPDCFSDEVLREDVFLKNAPTADDIWFWVMALVRGRKIRVVKNHNKTLICTNIFRQLFSKTLYKNNRQGKNDEQLENLIRLYGNNILEKLF